MEDSIFGGSKSDIPHAYIKGPNAQALIVQQRNDGAPVRTLAQQYVTPSAVQMPTFATADHMRGATVLPTHNGSSSASLVSTTSQKLRPSISELMRASVDSRANAAAKTILDGFVLLAASGMEFPDEARVANVVGKGLTTVVTEDLEYFNNLVFLDVSENALDPSSFYNLSSLIELRMAANNIVRIPQTLGEGFRNLQYLDMGYNALDSFALISLTLLPNLREVDLSGNNITDLPTQLSSFPALEKIVLDNNKIKDRSVFVTLGKIHNIREVSLAYNFIDAVPEYVCVDGFFRVLEFLDLSFNYIGNEEDIMCVPRILRLETLIIYGNPLLGPSGEDQLQMYVSNRGPPYSHLLTLTLLTLFSPHPWIRPSRVSLCARVDMSRTSSQRRRRFGPWRLITTNRSRW
jgi:Leucine-rich repeat (LRR) protein